MAVNSGNGWLKFSIGTQILRWNIGTANIFTSDPVDADGARLTGGALAAVAVDAGDQVGDGYDTTYWTFGEGPVECVLTSDDDAAIYVGSPWFKVEGNVVTVHPTQDQIESGRIGDGVDHSDLATSAGVNLLLAGYLEAPSPTPTEITGKQGTDNTAILVSLLAELDKLGIVVNATSMAATAAGAVTLTGTAAATGA